MKAPNFHQRESGGTRKPKEEESTKPYRRWRWWQWFPGVPECSCSRPFSLLLLLTPCIRAAVFSFRLSFLLFLSFVTVSLHLECVSTQRYCFPSSQFLCNLECVDSQVLNFCSNLIPFWSRRMECQANRALGGNQSPLKSRRSHAPQPEKDKERSSICDIFVRSVLGFLKLKLDGGCLILLSGFLRWHFCESLDWTDRGIQVRLIDWCIREFYFLLLELRR